MGWTSMSKPYKITEWFRGLFPVDKYEVLDVAIVHRIELYAAIKILATGEVSAAIWQLSYSNRSYYNFSYKDMDESCGPYLYNCPERILEVLTPTTNEYALKWREECWEMINARKKVRLRKGTIIKMHSSYYVCKDARRNRYEELDNNLKLYSRMNGDWTIPRHNLFSATTKILDTTEIMELAI